MLQLVFFCEKDSVAAMKMETSWEGREGEGGEGMAFGSWELVVEAAPGDGDGGGVG